MTTAFMILNAELGNGTYVETSLLDINEVKDVFTIYGVYDYIAKLRAHSTF
jgi:hypothetical protein